jgi:uncharacterized protein YceH (UPF0502 family)
MHLTSEEGRVIGSLIEKQLTTPQQYPLSLNSLVQACNQSSNRDPVVSYDEHTVQASLTSLRNAELIGFVYPSHGRSVTRYRHTLAERLGLDERELALLAVLLLRGPQTAGELRARSERMARFDGIDAVDADLVRLSEKTEPLVVRQSRRPGQKEERWAQLVCSAGPAEVADYGRTGSGAGASALGTAAVAGAGLNLADRELSSSRAGPAPVAGAGLSPAHEEAALQSPAEPLAEVFTEQRLAALAEEVATLRTEVEALRDAFDLLREQLGG